MAGERKKVMRHLRFGVFITLLLLAMLLMACEESTQTPGAASAPTPSFSAEAQFLTVTSIKQNLDVLDAAITQEGKQLSLKLVVPSRTSADRAKQLGDSFVRLAKTFGPGPSPQNNIGAGVFDFLITVVYLNEDIAVQGAKIDSASHISW